MQAFAERFHHASDILTRPPSAALASSDPRSADVAARTTRYRTRPLCLLGERSFSLQQRCRQRHAQHETRSSALKARQSWTICRADAEVHSCACKYMLLCLSEVIGSNCRMVPRWACRLPRERANPNSFTYITHNLLCSTLRHCRRPALTWQALDLLCWTYAAQQYTGPYLYVTHRRSQSRPPTVYSESHLSFFLSSFSASVQATAVHLSRLYGETFYPTYASSPLACCALLCPL